MCFSFSSSELHVDALVGGKDLCVSGSEGRQQQNCDIAYYCYISVSLSLSLYLSFSVYLFLFFSYFYPYLFTQDVCTKYLYTDMYMPVLVVLSHPKAISRILKFLQHAYICSPANVRNFIRIFLVGTLTVEITAILSFQQQNFHSE